MEEDLNIYWAIKYFLNPLRMVCATLITGASLDHSTKLKTLLGIQLGIFHSCTTALCYGQNTHL